MTRFVKILNIFFTAVLLCSCSCNVDTLDIKSIRTAEHESASYIETVYIDFTLDTNKCDTIPLSKLQLTQINKRFEKVIAPNSLSELEHYNYINTNVYVVFGADTIYGKILDADFIFCNHTVNTFIANPVSMTDVVVRNKIDKIQKKKFLLDFFEKGTFNVEYSGVAHWRTTPKVNMSFCDENTEEDTWY